MLFEERHLKPYAEPVQAAELKEGSVYFAVNYADEEMLMPHLEGWVFIGRDLDPEESGLVYFQDIDSYKSGVRYGVETEGDHARFYAGSEDEVKHIFEYDHALEELMRCHIRRRKLQ